MDTSEIIYEITEDRKAIENHYGKITRGMAYPYGTYSDKVIDVLRKCQSAYARTIKLTYSFGFPQNWLELHPTCHHDYENLEEQTSYDKRVIHNESMINVWVEIKDEVYCVKAGETLNIAQ